MDKKQVLEALKEAKSSKKRKFKQSIDLIINLRDLDLKKPEHNINTFQLMPHPKGPVKVCALVDAEMEKAAKEACDKVIKKDEFSKLGNKELKKLTEDYNFFIAQINLMPDVARYFGKTLGPRGLMPNPKAGCVVSSNVNLKDLKKRLERTIRLETKKELSVKCSTASEEMDDEKIVENIINIYSAVENLLPSGKANVKSFLIKLTMGKPVEVKDGSKSE